MVEVLSALCASVGYDIKEYEKDDEVRLSDLVDAEALMGCFPIQL